eukprot:CAMPEP_0174250922 /NCGR_PEP_ID=MMETSP0439-20130205/928_1 /TAXON_ID=0 /ORGANISM="Stereomyxa ramosa, Strain Chinc5" /LENGTH=88 /DNA_ID=CAMNT_0015331105 /DNA_START=82 /DNA_END=349 /DNA_ORIENTATION=-
MAHGGLAQAGKVKGLTPVVDPENLVDGEEGLDVLARDKPSTGGSTSAALGGREDPMQAGVWPTRPTENFLLSATFPNCGLKGGGENLE